MWNMSNKSMILGQSGLGKSTLVNTLFSTHLVDPKVTPVPADGAKQTTEIRQVSYCMSLPLPTCIYMIFSNLHFLCSRGGEWCENEVEYY